MSMTTSIETFSIDPESITPDQSTYKLCALLGAIAQSVDCTILYEADPRVIRSRLPHFAQEGYGHENISITILLPFPLIREETLSVSSKRNVHLIPVTCL